MTIVKRLFSLVVVCLLVASSASAGPIADAVKRQAAPTAPATQPTQPGKNKMLGPGLCLVGGGAALALYGFSHTDYDSIAVNGKIGTGVGLAGVGVAALGAVLIFKGQSDANKRTSIAVGPKGVRATVRW
jgi:hypothetical protein